MTTVSAGDAYRTAKARLRAKNGIYVLAQMSDSADLGIVRNLTKVKREQVTRHWHLVAEYLMASDQEKHIKAGNRIRAFAGHMTGGQPSVEFASDLPSIINWNYYNSNNDLQFEAMNE